MEKIFRKTKRCGSCGKEEVEFIDLKAAAFDHSAGLDGTCSNCGEKFVGSSKEMPTLNAEIMELWISNEDLRFFDQDEDLMLAGKENYDITIQFIDRSDALISKRLTLLSALCVNIYNIVKYQEGEKKLLDDSIREVSKRVKLIQEDSSMIFIMPYIREVVWPTLGLNY